VHCVDPGGTTGYATYAAGEIVEELTGQLPPQPYLELAHDLFRSRPTGGRLVVERFMITVATAKKSFQPDALEQIGALRYLARVECELELEMQTPAEVMRLVTDARLRELGWYRPGRVHCNDALRHLAVALLKSRELVLPL
jgi:hypothetical protein